jgi:AcrR family transcriptional regulator
MTEAIDIDTKAPNSGAAAARGPGRPGGDESRARIVAAAGRLFADRSFDGVSVRELAQAASVNAAAINYHFGGKEALYHEVLRQLIADTEPFFRIILEGLGDGLAQANGDRAALAHVTATLVRSLLSGVLGDEAARWQIPLLLREFHHPSGEFPMLIRERINPVHDAVGELVSAATGSDPMSPETKLLTANLIGQCMMFRVARGLVMARLGWDEYTPDRIELVVRTITPRVLAMLDLPSDGVFEGEAAR